MSEKPKLLYVDWDFEQAIRFVDGLSDDFDVWTANGVSKAYAYMEKGLLPDVILASNRLSGIHGIDFLKNLRTESKYEKIPFILVVGTLSPDAIIQAKAYGIFEVIPSIKPKHEVKELIHSAIKFTSEKPQKLQFFDRSKTPFYKRTMDVVVSGFALLLLSPLFLLVAILLKIESKAPVFYFSKRVGAGYKIFNVYKFRSMIPGADQKIDSLSGLNMYSSQSGVKKALCNRCLSENKSCDGDLLYISESSICENLYLENKKATSTFLKFKDDPRVTKLGKFIRNTSIDELPQLINIFNGDMSLVGNRPLPLYEAEKLTSGKHAERFLAPAGLTGLWQVTKRGKGNMSEEERIELDNYYAQHYSLWLDLKIIFKTIPAVFQSENV